MCRAGAGRGAGRGLTYDRMHPRACAAPHTECQSSHEPAVARRALYRATVSVSTVATCRSAVEDDTRQRASSMRRAATPTRWPPRPRRAASASAASLRADATLDKNAYIAQHSLAARACLARARVWRGSRARRVLRFKEPASTEAPSTLMQSRRVQLRRRRPIKRRHVHRRTPSKRLRPFAR